MAVTYGFFNSVNGDRKYNAEQMSEYFRGIVNEGVFQHLDGGLAVTAGTGLAVSVASGRAIIQNRWVQNSDAMTLSISAASETYARKDAVVVRLNYSTRSIEIAVKAGTPAASPSAPSMTRNSTTYEMALAYVNVAANATSVTITDKRSDSTVCGWATVAQSTSGEVDAQLNAMKTGFDGVEYDSPVEMVQGCDQKLQAEIDSSFNEIIKFDDYISRIGYEYLSDNDKESGTLYWVSGNKIQRGSGNNTATYSPFKIRSGKTFYYNNLYAYFCFAVDAEGNISRLSESTANFVNGNYTPSVDVDMYISINTSATVRRSFRTTQYSSINGTGGYYNVALSVDKYTHISVKADGTGDYASIVGAVRDIIDSSETNQYMIDVYEGTYAIWGDLGSQEKQGSMWGLTLPNYVHVRGIGNRDNIIIDCTNISPASTYEVEYTSCINLKQNNSLENITFRGRNIRYVVHDESSNTYQNWHRFVKNCKFIHFGNDSGYWAYTDAWGEGCSSGSYSYFEDCIFENYSYVAPFAFHTNTDFNSECTHIFKNCQFIQHYIGNDSTGAFRIDDIQCGKPINVEFVGCSFSSFIFVENHSSATDIEEINITGHGNNPVFLFVYRPNVSSPKRIFTKFSDEVAMVYNSSDNDFAAGRPLRFTSYKNNTIAIEQSNGLQCVGVALDTIPAHGMGYMKYAGILDLSTVGVSGISSGDKVGVSGWNVAKVTDGTEFARAIQTEVIKFL